MNILLEALKEIKKAREKEIFPATSDEIWQIATEAIKKWEALAEENNTLSEKLEMLNRSINAADPSGYDVVIKDLRKQIKSIIQSIPPYKGGENKIVYVPLDLGDYERDESEIPKSWFSSPHGWLKPIKLSELLESIPL